MNIKKTEKKVSIREHYDSHEILKEIIDKDVNLSLVDELRESILTGKRKRKLQNFSMKIDPLYLRFIKKIATTKGIPYQTLVREWLTENISKEIKKAS